MPDPIFTDAGLSLLLKALSGTVQLEFTRIVIGDGELTVQAPGSLTNVIHEVMSIPITRVKRRQNYISLGGPFDPSDLQSGFWWRELSLYAMDPDDGEIAFNYANAGNQGEYLQPDEKKLQRMLTINAFVSNLEGISVNINESLAFATVSDINEIRQEFTTDLATRLTMGDILQGSNITILRADGKVTISAADPGNGPVGPPGAAGAAGAAGVDAYTVILSSEAIAIPAGVSAALAGSFISNVIALKGATQMAATIGTITGQVTGLTTSITSNGTTNAYITISVAASLTTRSGVLTIPVTVDGKSFTKRVSWALALTGVTGQTGATGATGPAGPTNYENSVANIKMNGAVSPGALATAARGDHVHPSDTTRVPFAGGTLTGSLYAVAAATDYTTYRVRNVALMSSVPTSLNNGAIAMVYE